MKNAGKILIVDDEPFNVDYLEQELADSDYKIITACNGQDALNKVKEEVPDLVLLDIMMPLMDGFDVLSHLKADASTRNIPVIVISASNDLQSVVKGVQMGAEDYLPKPFEPTLLHARVTSSLEKKRLHDLQQLYLNSLERELEIGREIQMSFLPSELPVVDGWEIAAYFKAAHEVAGDFYDAFLLPDGNLVFVVGDVCDKGVGAALFMTLFRSLIRATSTSDLSFSKGDLNSLSPAERLHHIVTFTNNYVARTHEDAKFATIFIGIIDPKNSTLSYINCGNEPPILLEVNGISSVLKATGPVVGVMEKAEFVVKQIGLKQNDMLIAFTDGLPDSKSAGDEFFGSACLSSILNDRKIPASEALDCIKKKLDQFVGETEQFDDITLLAVKKVS